MDSFVTGRRGELIYSGVSTSCNLKGKEKHRGFYIAIFSRNDLHFHLIQRQFTQCQSAGTATLSITALFLLQGKERE